MRVTGLARALRLRPGAVPRVRGPAPGPAARGAAAAPGLRAPVPLDVAGAVADRGHVPRHAGGGAGRHRGTAGGAAGGRGDLHRPGRAACGGPPLHRGPGGRAGRRAWPPGRRPAPGTDSNGSWRDWDQISAGGSRMRIAMVSEHADPTAALGGTDAGGQNVHVGALAAALAGRGHSVTVYTRLTEPGRGPRRSAWARRGHRAPAGRRADRRRWPRTSCCRTCRSSGDRLARLWRPEPPDIVHAHFWMSGLASAARRGRAARPGGADLPRARRRSRPATRAPPDPSPASRVEPRTPRRPVLRPGHRHLPGRGAASWPALGVPADADLGRAVRRGHRQLHARTGRPRSRNGIAPGCWPSAGWSSVRASTTAIAALAAAARRRNWWWRAARTRASWTATRTTSRCAAARGPARGRGPGDVHRRRRPGRTSRP